MLQSELLASCSPMSQGKNCLVPYCSLCGRAGWPGQAGSNLTTICAPQRALGLGTRHQGTTAVLWFHHTSTPFLVAPWWAPRLSASKVAVLDTWCHPWSSVNRLNALSHPKTLSSLFWFSTRDRDQDFGNKMMLKGDSRWLNSEKLLEVNQWCIFIRT